jgi:hypothetical protein
MWPFAIDNLLVSVLAIVAVSGLLFAMFASPRAARRQEAARATEGHRLQSASDQTATLRTMIAAALLPEPDSDAVGRPDMDSAQTAQRILTHLRPHADGDGSGYSNTLRVRDMKKDSDQRSACRLVVVASSLGLLKPLVVATSPPADPIPASASVREDDATYLLHRDVVLALTERLAVLAQPVQPLITAMPAETVTVQPLPSVIQPPTITALARANPSEHEIEQSLIEHFAAETGQQVGTIEYLNRHFGKIDVVGLKRCLDLVLRHNETALRRPLNFALKSLERSIDTARGQLPARLLAPPHNAAVAATFAERLKGMTVAMVMLPGATYEDLIGTMVAELDLAPVSSAADADPARVQRRQILEQHRSELTSAELSADHWAAVRQSLITFERGLAALTLGHQAPPRSA